MGGLEKGMDQLRSNQQYVKQMSILFDTSVYDITKMWKSTCFS